MSKKVIILRGCSGAGKSTVAHLFSGKSVICTADDFFYDEKGVYNFDASKLSDAHTDCRLKFVTAIHDDSIDTIIVANTNTQEKEFDFYLDGPKGIRECRGFRTYVESTLKFISYNIPRGLRDPYVLHVRMW